MRVFSIEMMLSAQPKKIKNPTLEIIHDGVVMTKITNLCSIPIKNAIMTTENKSIVCHSKNNHSDIKFYVVADGVVIM
jgi:hypothetical protein